MEQDDGKIRRERACSFRKYFTQTGVGL